MKCAIILFAFALHPLTSLASCPVPNEITPLCPQSGATILPDTYPVQSVVVSTRSFMGGKSSFEMPADFISQIFQAYDYSQAANSIPQIIVPTNKSVFPTLIQMVKQKLVDAHIPDEQREKLIAQIVLADTKSYTWQQDYFETTINPQSGSPLLRVNAGYAQTHGGLNPDKSLEQMALASIECDLKVGTPIPSDMSSYWSPVKGKSYGGGEFGGNMDGLPGGLCLYGDNLSQTVADSFCGTSRDNHVQIDTGWLKVGHVDEMVKVIPRAPREGVPEECNFTIMIADPNRGLDALKSAGDSLFFNSPASRSSEEKDQYAQSLVGDSYNSQTRFFCNLAAKKFLNSQKSLPQEPEQTPTLTDPELKTRGAFFKVMNFIFPSSWAGLDVMGESSYKTSFDCSKHILDLTNSEVYKAITEDSEMMEFNRLAQEFLSKNKEKINSQISQRLPQCQSSLDFLPAPDLFLGTVGRLEDGTAFLPMPGNGDSLLPNPTNSVVVNKTVIFPDPQNAAFRDILSTEITKRGLKVGNVDTWEYAHLGSGNLHCASHTLPYCRPEGAPQ